MNTTVVSSPIHGSFRVVRDLFMRSSARQPGKMGRGEEAGNEMVRRGAGVYTDRTKRLVRHADLGGVARWAVAAAKGVVTTDGRATAGVSGVVASLVAARSSGTFGPAVLTAATRLRIFFVETQEMESEDTRSEVGE